MFVSISSEIEEWATQDVSSFVAVSSSCSCWDDRNNDRSGQFPGEGEAACEGRFFPFVCIVMMAWEGKTLSLKHYSYLMHHLPPARSLCRDFVSLVEIIIFLHNVILGNVGFNILERILNMIFCVKN